MPRAPASTYRWCDRDPKAVSNSVDLAVIHHRSRVLASRNLPVSDLLAIEACLKPRYPRGGALRG